MPQKLFDSSRFNYDSDEEEDEQQQAGSAAAPASAAPAAAEEQAVEIALPPPRGVRVKTAEFIKSSVNVEQCPPPRFPEFAGEGGGCSVGVAARRQAAAVCPSVQCAAFACTPCTPCLPAVPQCGTR